MSEPVLEVQEIDAFYGSSQVLFGMSMSVFRGETLALLGRNGAGKSTTMKSVAGVVAPRRGKVRLFGREIGRLAPHRIARFGVGFVPEDRQIFPELSVEDNLAIAAKPDAGGQVSWTLERIYEMLPLLAPLKRRLGGQLSGGEQQMLTIGRASWATPPWSCSTSPARACRPSWCRR